MYSKIERKIKSYMYSKEYQRLDYIEILIEAGALLVYVLHVSLRQMKFIFMYCFAL